jgi:hypothetical protein
MKKDDSDMLVTLPASYGVRMFVGSTGFIVIENLPEIGTEADNRILLTPSEARVILSRLQDAIDLAENGEVEE